MKRSLFAGAAVLMLLAVPDSALAKHKHYGSFGVQFGFYRSPAPGHAAPAAPAYGCYGYAPSYGYAPAFMMAPAPMVAAPMMAPAAGCYGSSYGYSPGYSAGYAYSPGYGYSGYGAQSGLLFPGGSILDVLRMVREFKQVVEELRPGGDGDPATRQEIDKLRSEVEALRKEVKAIETPRNLDQQIAELKQTIEKQRNDFEVLKKHLRKNDPNIP